MGDEDFSSELDYRVEAEGGLTGVLIRKSKGFFDARDGFRG